MESFKGKHSELAVINFTKCCKMSKFYFKVTTSNNKRHLVLFFLELVRFSYSKMIADNQTITVFGQSK